MDWFHIGRILAVPDALSVIDLTSWCHGVNLSVRVYGSSDRKSSSVSAAFNRRQTDPAIRATDPTVFGNVEAPRDNDMVVLPGVNFVKRWYPDQRQQFGAARLAADSITRT